MVRVSGGREPVIVAHPPKAVQPILRFSRVRRPVLRAGEPLRGPASFAWLGAAGGLEAPPLLNEACGVKFPRGAGKRHGADGSKDRPTKPGTVMLPHDRPGNSRVA